MGFNKKKNKQRPLLNAEFSKSYRTLGDVYPSPSPKSKQDNVYQLSISNPIQHDELGKSREAGNMPGSQLIPQ